MDWLTAFGALAVTAMLIFYALESRSPAFVLAFAGACLASSAYGFLQGAWPFGVVEAIWSAVALRHGAGGAGSPAEPVFRTGDLEVDLEHRLVRVGGQEVHLTPTEYDLLRALVSHPNKVLTERMLLDRVWGGAAGAEAHYVHVYAARLRKKLEANPQKPRYLRTEPGVGYRLVLEE